MPCLAYAIWVDMPADLGPVGQCDMFKTEVVEARHPAACVRIPN